jgi:V-type H+-transporting ATPase subunit G
MADEVDRVQKLKDARSEAAKEIEEYKSKKEAEYKKFETDVRALTLLD